jgi:hypothetical protein
MTEILSTELIGEWTPANSITWYVEESNGGKMELSTTITRGGRSTGGGPQLYEKQNYRLTFERFREE